MGKSTLGREGPGILTKFWPRKLLSLPHRIVRTNHTAIWFMLSLISHNTLIRAMNDPIRPADKTPKLALLVDTATANPVSAVINIVPSTDRFTTPDLSVIVSPITTNTSGALRDIIVINEDSK